LAAKRNKGKKAPKVDEKPKEEKPKPAFNHHVEILRHFEHVKVSPPKELDELKKTIETIQEKKTYFDSLKEKKEPEAGAKDTTTKPTEKESPKKHQTNKKEGFNYKNIEEEFPGLKI